MLRRLLLVTGGGATFAAPVENFETLYNGTDADGPYAIGAATFDGSTWTVYGSNPVLEKGTGGTWDDDHVKDPCLIWDGSQYVVYYAGHDGTKYQIGRATASSLTGPWTKYASNPVLAVGSSGAIDDAGVNFPTVYFDGTSWRMWYGADDGTKQTVGYADSSDGVTWTKHGRVIDIGAGGTWNDVGMLPGAIYKEGSTWYLFANGRQGTTNPRWQGGLWTFTDPEGTYTADGDNPILLSRFNDANTAQSISGTASSGGTTVSMGSTAAFFVGEPVAIADADSDTDIRTIVSIDSGTQVTVTPALASTFAAANGGAFRPFAYNSVFFRTVRRTQAGTYEAFFTPFQPVTDLSPGGTLLREGSMRATATSLDGPWSFDYDTGLMFPIQDGGWDNLSAENLSAIPLP